MKGFLIMKDLTAKSFKDLKGKNAVFKVEAFGGVDDEGTQHEPMIVELVVKEVVEGRALDAYSPPEHDQCSTTRIPFSVVFEGQKMNEACEGCPPLPDDTYLVTNAKLGTLEGLHLVPDMTPLDPKDMSKGVCHWTRRFVASFC